MRTVDGLSDDRFSSIRYLRHQELCLGSVGEHPDRPFSSGDFQLIYPAGLTRLILPAVLAGFKQLALSFDEIRQILLMFSLNIFEALGVFLTQQAVLFEAKLRLLLLDAYDRSCSLICY